MKFQVKDTLTEDEIQTGLRAVIKDGLCSHAMGTLTGGIFLVALAINLKASNFVIGLMAALPPLLNLIQIPAIYLVEKYRVRRAISVFASISSRLFWLLIGLIPFLFSQEVGLIVLVVAITLNSIFGSISNCSWNSWMRDLIPQDRLGAFFSKRMMLSTGLGIIFFLANGFYITYWKKQFPDYEIYGYSPPFILGFILGMLGVYYISTIPEPRMVQIKEEKGLFMLISKPFKDINFRNLIIFLGSWNFAINLAAPFFTVYMIKRLQFEMSFIIILTVLCQIANLTFLRLWGKFSDRFSNKSILRVSAPLFVFCILGWTFTTLPEKHMFTIPLLIIIHLFMGIAIAGVTLATGNISLKLAPKGQATAYLVVQGLISSVAASIAPVLGGTFIDYFSYREFSITLNWTDHGVKTVIPALYFSEWDFFFFFSFLLAFYSIHRLVAVKEVGEVEEKVVIHELLSEVRRGMRNFSTVGGLRYMIQLPLSTIRSSTKNKH